jgi:hypothetical protein
LQNSAEKDLKMMNLKQAIDKFRKTEALLKEMGPCKMKQGSWETALRREWTPGKFFSKY